MCKYVIFVWCDYMYLDYLLFSWSHYTEKLLSIETILEIDWFYKEIRTLSSMLLESFILYGWNKLRFHLQLMALVVII